MHFLLDENVPVSVAETIKRLGHKSTHIRDYVLAGAPDPVVATVSEKIGAILISFDGDFQKIAPRIPRGMRQRFRKLSRISMKCHEPHAAKRIEAAFSLIEFEYRKSQSMPDMRMILWIADSYIRTNR